MFYVFNSKNKCIASCDFEPDTEDIKSRNEFCIESDIFVEMGDTYTDGLFRKDKVGELANYEIKARNYRNTLRDKLDNHLKPASTLNDELVTEDQKVRLINDSLLLARWPATVGWPYIPLPELSDTALDILGNPTWEFDKWK